MKLGLLHGKFYHATRENDSDRLSMLLKFLMLLFNHHGHTKYELDGLPLTARLEATLTPRMAELLDCEQEQEDKKIKTAPSSKVQLQS